MLPLRKTIIHTEQPRPWPMLPLRNTIIHTEQPRPRAYAPTQEPSLTQNNLVLGLCSHSGTIIHTEQPRPRPMLPLRNHHSLHRSCRNACGPKKKDVTQIGLELPVCIFKPMK